ncbi:ribosomal silencing factor RsfS-like protein, 312 isoform X1 [Megalopta genalis]|uniref:ribosomal silencing factor RsfS-like protein, 312 isoform X1 n=1 Tax=Megalopta genalis TaxID=115081 RepID=UPI003FCF2778
MYSAITVNITLVSTCATKMRGRLQSYLLQSRKLLFDYCKPRVNNVITYSQLKQVRQFSIKDNTEFNGTDNLKNSSRNLPGSLSNAYKVFDDKDAEIILDEEVEKETIQLEDLQSKEEYYDPYEGINLERGVTGVYEIEDLVSLLHRENAKNIFVASVPPEFSYVDYIVIVTGISQKHSTALATFVRKVYKLKKCQTDFMPKIEGEKSKDWLALDLGNIALHIFSKSARILYDLETLWTVGPEYDSNNKNDTDADIMEQFNQFLSDMDPIDENDTKKK